MRVKALRASIILLQLPKTTLLEKFVKSPGLLGLVLEGKKTLAFCRVSKSEALAVDSISSWKAIVIEGIPSLNASDGILAKALSPLRKMKISVLVISGVTKDYIFYDSKVTKYSHKMIAAKVRLSVLGEHS